MNAKNTWDTSQIREQILSRIRYDSEISDEEVYEIVDEVLQEHRQFHMIPPGERKEIRQKLFDSLRRLDILQGLLEDPEVTEIMVNGPNHIFVEKKGRIQELEEKFESAEKLSDVIQQIVASCNRTVNDRNPIVDARIMGARVNIVLSAVALNGPIVTIRRFPHDPITMEQLISFGAISMEVAAFLEKLVRAKYNIIISGGTGSGKTTFLNVLSGYVPKQERIITIEDNAELQLQGIHNLVSLETRDSTLAEGKRITIRDLIRTSLRMRPDRIIVGEVRGEETYDMMQCLNTGHDGSMSTAHANSAGDLCRRLENMILMGLEIPLSAIRRQIAAGVDIIIHLGRLRDGSRKVLEIQEVMGIAQEEYQLSPLYLFEEEGSVNGKVVGKLKKGAELQNDYKLKAAGILE